MARGQLAPEVGGDPASPGWQAGGRRRGIPGPRVPWWRWRSQRPPGSVGAPAPGGVSSSHHSSGEDPRLRGPEAFKESERQDHVGRDPCLPPLVPPALPS